MNKTIGHHQALIYTMVTMAGVDKTIRDSELQRIGRIVQTLPVFHDFDPERLVQVAQECGEIVGADGGLAQACRHNR